MRLNPRLGRHYSPMVFATSLRTSADCLSLRTCEHARPLPKVSYWLNCQTTFLSRVISKICGLLSPAWQLPTTKLPLSSSVRNVVHLSVILVLDTVSLISHTVLR